MLREGASGVINNAGLQLSRIDQLIVRKSGFENTALGLLSENSRPTLTDNNFENNLIAIQVSGNRVPAAMSRNIFAGNRTAVENLSALPLPAQDNYWGTTDSTAISAMIKGLVEWMPFLGEKPGQTAVQVSAGAKPTHCALHANFSNPFNAQTAIHFDLARKTDAELVIFDVLGRPLRRWLQGPLAPGSYQQIWDGRDQDGQPVASGVYLYRLRAGEFKAAGRLLLLR